jgi:predicted adenine nucleotide alpha hydrolase (AANH) superfamily ATPase
MPILRLQDEGFIVTTWFINPNIHPLTEYLRRREAAQEACVKLGVEFLRADESCDVTAWRRAAAGRDTKPARCVFCCENRVNAVFAKAREMGFPFFSSSLLYSRYQQHEIIAAAGRRLARQGRSSDFVYRDFRLDWQTGIDRSRQMGLYRQTYCGCVYSKAESYAKRLAGQVKTNFR